MRDSDSMADKIAPAFTRALVPISRAAEEIRQSLIYKNKGLWKHNPEAINLATVAHYRAKERANGHTPDIRCDKSERVRRMELGGALNLSVATICGMALENDLGRDVALEILRVIAAAVDHSVTPNSETATALEPAMAGVLGAIGMATTVAGESMADGHVDTGEAARFDEAMAVVKAKVARWEASRAPKVVA